MSRKSGQCLCGSVRFEAEVADEMGACHCAMCRRWSGGVFFAVEASDMVVADPAAMRVYDSSEWAERCFCATCGSSIAWRSKDGQHLAVAVQAFDDVDSFAFTTQIFIDEKPATYNFREATRDQTGAEVMAAFAPKSE